MVLGVMKKFEVTLLAEQLKTDFRDSFPTLFFVLSAKKVDNH
jgi:hypothetical protein